MFVGGEGFLWLCLVGDNDRRDSDAKSHPFGEGSKAFLAATMRYFVGRSACLYLNFLDASSHLYKRVCPSVRPSVRRSVRRYVMLL